MANRAPATDAAADFMAALHDALASGSFGHLLLANPSGTLEGVQRVLVRALHIKREPQLSFTFRHGTGDHTHNTTHERGLQEIAGWAGAAFRNLHLFTPGQELQLAFNRKGKASLRRGKGEVAENGTVAQAGHNREKHRLVPLDRPFLAALGITDALGALVPAMARKYRQINRFVEVLAAALETLPRQGDAPVRVADFGCGKGYLTFAVHDHLRHGLQRPLQVTGVELRAELVDFCNAAVQRLSLQDLHFEPGDLATFKPQPLDVVIALHACDTATDQAIHLGLQAGAQVIVCSPCCHKQLRPQLLAPHPLRPILQHGIHMGQEAEMLTDGLRALLLQAQGYATQVFEFVALEHTAKNKMILAVKGGVVPPREEVLQQIDEVKRFYGVREQALESLLRSARTSQELLV